RVEKPRDIRMVETGQDLAFLMKPSNQGRACQRGPNDLDGHLLVKRAIDSRAEVYGAHAATSDFAQDLVCANATPFHPGDNLFFKFQFCSDKERILKEPARTLMSGQEPLQLGKQRVIAATRLFEKLHAPGRILFQRRFVQVSDLTKALWSHRNLPESS